MDDTIPKLAHKPPPRTRKPRIKTILTPKQEQRIGQRLKSSQNLFRRCFTGLATRNQAIKANCLDCMGEDKKGISECADRCCPLWHFRPYQKRL